MMRLCNIAAMTTISLWLSGCERQVPLANDVAAAIPAATEKSASNPVVVELYQSQGCSSCPPANAALNTIADQSNVIALSFAVTYWDRLGWKDIFADTAYTQRQYNYAEALGKANVYTPQMVINGTRAITGNRPGELTRALAASKPVSGEPKVEFKDSIVTVGAGRGSADVWLVRYDPRIQNVQIRAGENGGKTLPHKNVVRQLSRIGGWNGQSASFKIFRPTNAGWKSVILVQRVGAGPIISAKKI